MPTIKDIAQLAGVSHGTVSNVLNKRGNVSVEKIKLVEKAARELGFKMNTQAKQLRQGHTNRVCMLVPHIEMKRYRDLFEGLNNELRSTGYEVELSYTNDLNYYEEPLLERAISSNPAALVVISSYVRNPGIFQGDTRFIFVDRYVSQMPEHSLFVSFDFRKAGTELAARCIEEGAGTVAIFCSGTRFSDRKEFHKATCEVLDHHACDYQLFAGDIEMGINSAYEILFARPRFDAVITDSEKGVEYLRTVHSDNPDIPFPKIYGLTGKETIQDKQVTRYSLNYKLCGKKIADYIREAEMEEGLFTDHIVLENDGFEKEAIFQWQGEKTERINILMLASPTSSALKYFLPGFTKRTGISVQLMEVPYDELYECASDSLKSNAFDMIRLDMAWLSELGEKLFLPLDLEEEPFRTIRRNISEELSADYYQVGTQVYSLPFDPSVQILYYRKDLFEDALLKRKFYERFKRQLTIPKTFHEYNEVAEFFTRKFNPDSPTIYGTSMSYGSAAVAACDYLPRLKAAGVPICDEHGRICIDTPLVAATLKEYIKADEYTDQSLAMWWRHSAEAFAKGTVAMNIVFSNHASGMVQNQKSKVVGKLGFADVPGKCPLLGGGVIGISKNTKKTDACKEFLRWIYDEQVAAGITRLGGYINHNKLVDNIDILELYPWVEGMEQAFSIGWRREHNKHAGFDEFKFEKIFGISIRSAVSGIQSVEDALKDAQMKCDEAFHCQG